MFFLDSIPKLLCFFWIQFQNYYVFFHKRHYLRFRYILKLKKVHPDNYPKQAHLIPNANIKQSFFLSSPPTLSKGEGVKIGLFYIFVWYKNRIRMTRKYNILGLVNRIGIVLEII
jgi:hypothetical protein